jgi:hypothetical protein
MLEFLQEHSPESIDLTDPHQSQHLQELAGKLLEREDGADTLIAWEDELIGQGSHRNIGPLLVLKLARSKLMVQQLTNPLSVSIVFAMYKEHNRILKPEQHPHGEDFLTRKIEQLNWLFDDQPLATWQLIAVDDGCPEDSGVIAQNLITENRWEHCARVLFLEKAIEKNLPIVSGLKSTSDSQKGGSIVYGMWDAVQDRTTKDHLVVYTDADLSTHLGQLMLLIEPLVNDDKQVAIGSRREQRSVVIKHGGRNDRGKLFIYLWKRMIPNLGDIIDTQCGFKAFRADLVSQITDGLIEKKFAFDIELLLKAELNTPGSIARVPIAWIDSEAASTTTDLQPYLPMLKAIAHMNRKYFPHDGTNEFVEFLNDMS